MSNIPQNIPEGAIRYNTDSNKMEVYIGGTWMIVSVSTPNLDGGARGVFMGASVPSGDSQISYITIPTAGNAINFGSRTISGMGANLSSRTRGLSAGDTAPTYVNTIDFITLSSTGSAVDFGDRTNTAARSRGCSNQTRGIWAGGFIAPATPNVMDFVTIASTGNAVDFGDLTGNRENPAGNMNSPTRAIWAAGDTDGAGNFATNTQFVTIASTGNAQDFGDLSAGRSNAAGLSSATRGLIGGGYVAPTGINLIEFITIATLGDTTNFGDCTVAKYSRGSTTDCIRGVFVAGQPSTVNTIDYVIISTQGDAVDFGDYTNGCGLEGGCSTGHGGL
tara:strand:- start:30 stop:1031 length:1002 start_codon:yes stop_codon:yes gene_type:complete